jgi:hypothetical protein
MDQKIWMTSFSTSIAFPSTIQLSMEMETEDNLPFLDIQYTRSLPPS